MKCIVLLHYRVGSASVTGYMDYTKQSGGEDKIIFVTVDMKQTTAKAAEFQKAIGKQQGFFATGKTGQTMLEYLMEGSKLRKGSYAIKVGS